MNHAMLDGSSKNVKLLSVVVVVVVVVVDGITMVMAAVSFSSPVSVAVAVKLMVVPDPKELRLLWTITDPSFVIPKYSSPKAS